MEICIPCQNVENKKPMETSKNILSMETNEEQILETTELRKRQGLNKSNIS